MSRVTIAIMSVAIAATISSTAGAGTGKWCFQWDISYADQDTDPDHNTYWLDDDSVHAPARYTYVVVIGPSTCDEYFLDSSGCT
ncbi:MAG: hypothetical protein M0R80_09660, partial [Proteobacteria bacterium]|nr:hypothetical protein [Pseudomonadota bacterium]